MITGRYPFDLMWNEMEEMNAELEHMFRIASPGGRLLPAGGVTSRMLPVLRNEFCVDVREHDDEVIVAADIPGVKKRYCIAPAPGSKNP